ncbi:MAG TPA: hypothetical protein PKI49_00985 [Pseudomonadota bacterium]|jgi:hypothetical protein|nr:hypothetical protein [Pseudomonadota bacterium]HND09220.1 hypothetical protein [Pseudomonadota bacterium]HNF96555.1 hypothetical protein [Pseudomonadota bacterium]HNI58398.1 hypothetical protein [Pseudomonadota bacterium]HNK43198.1 hypothetical protein [Pseudomonadota bacterium]
MKVITLQEIQQAFAYLVSKPDYLLRSAVNATRFRFGLPMDAVTWLLGKLSRGKLPEDLSLVAVPPGVRFSATFNVMGTALFVSAVVSVDGVQLSAESIRVNLRIRELQVKPPADSPMAAMLMMMDLSKPGDMLAFLPFRPQVILSAAGDEFVLDLIQLPKLKTNAMAKRVVAAVSEILTIREFATEDDMLVIGLRAMPSGIVSALGHLRGA